MGNDNTVRRKAAELLQAAGGDPLRAIGLAWFRYFVPSPPRDSDPTDDQPQS